MRLTTVLIVALIFSFTAIRGVYAGEVRVAVAANFTQTAKRIGRIFAQESGHHPIFSFASTGQLYAQISQGAPFDVFLSADRLRAKMAIEKGFAAQGSRFSYATGRLALFSPHNKSAADPSALARGNFQKIAIANPLTAPYGAAAVETMKSLGVYSTLRPKLVQGNNIAQTYQFVYTGNAALGFVALSQIAGHEKGYRWIVPEQHHSPLKQDAVLLKTGKNNAAARAFLSFLKTPAAKTILMKHGYGAGE